MKAILNKSFFIFISFFVLQFSSRQIEAQQIAHFSFNESGGVNTTTESVSQTTFSVNNHFDRPERIGGIEGNALRLDGYSTWISNSTFQFTQIQNKITISSWYATEAFNKENGGIISQLTSSAGFALEVGPFGNVSFVFYADGTKYSLQTSQKLTKYAWNHIVATIDLSNAIARILVNGDQWAIRNLDNHTNINLSNTTLYIGRHNNDIRNEGFLVTALNGAIDEVKLYKNILTDEEINSEYQAHAQLIPNLTIDPYVRYAGDYLRPRFHAMPNACWTNECYGLNYYKGKYHLFFQKNPNSPSLYFMHWGHLTSPDLVNWTEEKIALAPSPGFDSFGVWSGTTIKNDTGVPAIIYTGVDGVKAGIGIATSNSESLDNWTKSELNPLIPSPPSGYQHMDFRDPYVWKSGEFYYMIVGSGIQNNGGGILFTYKSSDLLNWTTINPLYRNVYINETGYFWEMPFFYKLNDNDEYLLGVNPTPQSNKPAETLYWIGKWQNEHFTPYFSSPKKFEHINGLMLAPSLGIDTSGRSVYLGIIPENRDAASQIEGEWRHVFSLPRAFRLLTDSTIGQIPHPNLCRLRDTLTQITNRIIEPGYSNNFPEFQGIQAEMKFTIKADSASRFSIQLFKHQDAQEFTSIVFDLSTNKISFDRAHSSLSAGTPKDYRSNDYIFNFKDTLNVTVFLDHSIIEVFIDNLAVFSLRVYPTRIQSQKVDFIVNKGRAEIVNLKAWSLKDMKDVVSAEVCEPEHLPERFRRKSDLLGMIEPKAENCKLKLFPNPANTLLQLEFNTQITDSLSVTIVDNLGNKIHQVSLAPNRENKYTIDLKGFKPGSYLLTAIGVNVMISQHFVIIQ